MNKFAFIDIDGTCAHVGSRLSKNAPPKNVSRQSKVYINWLKKVQARKLLLADKPVKSVKRLINRLIKSGVICVYLTSRNNDLESVTKEWLHYHKFPDLPLIMRGRREYQEYHKFKERKINKLTKNIKNPLIIVVDDDPRGLLLPICEKNCWVLRKATRGGKGH